MIRIEPFTAVHVPAVKAFNQRLREGGVAVHQAPVNPEKRPPFAGTRNHISSENYVAVEDDTAVRGFYSLVSTNFCVAGESREVGFLQIPLSEGVVNPKFGMLGVSLLKDVMNRSPLLYGLGMGSMDRPIARLFKTFGAELREVPFFFRVCRAGSFLLNVRALRSDRWRALGADIAAATGIGSIGLAALNAWQARREPPAGNYSVDQVPRFDAWCDRIWDRAQSEYSFLAVRDAETLNYRYEKTELPLFRLRVSVGGEAVGWAVVLSAQLKDHNHFPNMKLGSIVDCLALPGSEALVVAAAERHLKKTGADLIVSNQMAIQWQQALTACGFRRYHSNFIFAAPKPLWALLKPVDTELSRAHINRGDGDGPYNLS
jgi:hypothetical protein